MVHTFSGTQVIKQMYILYMTESTERDTAAKLLRVDLQVAEARSALATAAVHVARAEERSAALEQVAADTSQQLLIAAQLADEMERRQQQHRSTLVRLYTL